LLEAKPDTNADFFAFAMILIFLKLGKNVSQNFTM
jgi:hypothetical protein